MNLRKKPVQQYRTICFLLLLLTFAPALALATDCHVQDPGFEAGTPSPYWDEYSNPFNTPIQEFNPLFPEVGSPHSGRWWVFFGGYTGEVFGWVEQSVEIPVGDEATLDFYLAIPYADNPGYLRVFIDQEQLIEVTDADADSYHTYSLVSLDVSDYADGELHDLRFESTTYAGDGEGLDVTDFWVDDICITVTTSNGITKAMPWLFLLLFD